MLNTTMKIFQRDIPILTHVFNNKQTSYLLISPICIILRQKKKTVDAHKQRVC